MRPTLSVVIPTYNEELILARCLAALRNQDVQMEILVVDGGSSDSTVDVAAKWADEVIVSREADSPAAARNMGAEAASGDVIAFVDADTVVAEGWAQAILGDFSDESVVGVTGPVLPLSPASFWEVLGHLLSYDIFVRLTMLVGRAHMLGLNVAYRRDFFLDVGGFPPFDLSEDVMLSSIVSKIGKVLFDRRMVAYTSPRRLRKMGVGWSSYYLFFNGLKTLAGLKPEDYYPKVR